MKLQNWENNYMPTTAEIHSFVRAIDEGNTEKIRSMISDDNGLIDVDYYGETPLTQALRNHKPEIAKLLIELGADINLAGNNGNTPFYFSVIENHPQVSQLLIEKNVILDVTRRDIIEVFHAAIRLNKVELVELLIDKKIDINAKDYHGNTPLIKALQSKRLDMAKLLIEQGADITLPDKNGKTPIQYAIDEGQFEIVNLLSKNKLVTLELKYRKVDQANVGLEANFAIARKRSQPYINLTNNIYSLELLSSEDTFKKYKEMELKSLYFRTDKISLDETLSEFLTKLTDEGIKEVVIFCDKNDQELNTDKFNNFLRDNKIRINLRIAPVTQEDLASIEIDSVGKKDILGFAKLNDYKIYYQDGHSISLLNDGVSDQTIIANHNKHKEQIAEKHQFIVQEPEYITSSNDNEERRIKDPEQAKKNLKLEAEVQVSRNNKIDNDIDFNAQVDIEQETEQENELDLPLEQLEHKYIKGVASSRSEELAKKSFTESHIQRKFEFIDVYRVSDNIFDSDPSIRYITEEALRLVVKNRHILEHGIDINNMPIGLALKDGIIFKSMQRPKSMPINELTPRLNPIGPSIDHPLEYSWLQYVTKASLTPNDLYHRGSDITPKIRGQEDCPVYYYSNKNTDSLDYPISQKYLAYEVEELEQKPEFSFERSGSIDQRLILDQKIYPKVSYPRLEFSNLSILDKKSFYEIYAILGGERFYENIYSKLDQIDRRLEFSKLSRLDKESFYETYAELDQESFYKICTKLDQMDQIDRRLEEFSNVSRSDIDHLYLVFAQLDKKLKFSNLSELDKKRLDEIYVNLDQREITKGFNAIIRSGSMKNGDFLLEERTAVFLEKLFKEILPFPGDKEKLEFFKEVVNNHTFDKANLEEVFEGLNGFYPKLQEFMLNQEIQGEQRLEVIDKIINIVRVQASNSRGFKTLMNRLVKTLEHITAKGGSLYEQLAYLESKDALLLGDPKILHAAKESEANAIHKSAKLGQKDNDRYTQSVRDLVAIPPYKRANINVYDQYYSQKLSNVEYISGEKINKWPFLKEANKDYRKLVELLAKEATRRQNAQNKDYQEKTVA